MRWVQDMGLDLQVLHKTSRKCLKIHLVPTCRVLKFPKGAVAASMDRAPNLTGLVVVIQDSLILRERMIAQPALVVLLCKQVKTMSLDLRSFQPHAKPLNSRQASTVDDTTTTRRRSIAFAAVVSVVGDPASNLYSDANDHVREPVAS